MKKNDFLKIQPLKAEISFQKLDAIAYAMSDNTAARDLYEARAELLHSINNAQLSAA